MLTQSLRELEADGIVSRKAFNQVPLKVVYSMTKYGHTLDPLFEALCHWGEKDFKRRDRTGRKTVPVK
jgi:DNA-binding HxlR family transcriptional regulator